MKMSFVHEIFILIMSEKEKITNGTKDRRPFAQFE